MRAVVLALVLVLTLTLLAPTTLCADLTRQPGASGTFVVESSLKIMDNTDVFDNDYTFLRRVAYVATQDGTAESTYAPPYSGGVWAVSEAAFKSTQDTESHGQLVNFHVELKVALGIQWMDLEWGDTRAPLISALAARMYMTTLGVDIPATVDGQALYWKTWFDTSASTTNATFVNGVAAMEASLSCSTDPTLMLVLDSSGSIGASNYAHARSFLQGLVEELGVAPGKTRVGLVYYSSRAYPYMNFTDDLAQAKADIAAVPYVASGTHTGEAMRLAISEFQALPDDDRAYVMIVLTDGRSADGVRAPAKAALDSGITTLAVGIGSGVDEDELLEIANGEQSNVILSTSYQAIDNAAWAVRQATCSAPTAFDTDDVSESRTLGPGEIAYGRFTVPEQGITLAYTVSEGGVTAYVSFSFATPNPAFYDVLVRPGPGTYIPLPPADSPSSHPPSPAPPPPPFWVPAAPPPPPAPRNQTMYVGFLGSSSSQSNTFSLRSSAGGAPPDPPYHGDSSGLVVILIISIMFGTMVLAVVVVVVVWRIRAPSAALPDFVRNGFAENPDAARPLINGPLQEPGAHPADDPATAASAALPEPTP